MKELSDRQHDAFANPAKAACREGNLRVLRGATQTHAAKYNGLRR